MRFIQYLIIGKNQVFGKLLTNQKIAHKIVKPYVYKALREGLKTHDNGKIQNLRGFGSLSLRILIVPKCTIMLETNVLGIFFVKSVVPK